MIRHIVMWKLRGDTPEEKQAARLRVKSAFEDLIGRIPGLLSLEVGSDQSGADYACDVVMVSEFCDAQALAAYATDREHLRVRDELGDLRTHRYQVDYAVSEPAPSH
ncbi:Dabb family protein [Pseudomonas sp. UL073]|uniref:Dabb family protein n=1 Tax=Zestomonas insulae TaxID=2809017 RepID=A0ABS2IDB9_9GAMM|nr:Dabb family protein [Pseudomonas insulae]